VPDPASAVWWLRLAALNETAHRKNSLLAHFGSPEVLFAAEDAAWQGLRHPDGLRERVRQGGRRDVTAWLARLEAGEFELIARPDPDYPPLLATIPDPPPLLFLRGRPPVAGQPAVALVGTRRSSPYGNLVAEDLAKGLATAGVAVVSGLAAGIDAAAHCGALRAGGATVAVLGTGIDKPYPAQNQALYQRMVAEGGVLSEFPPGTAPRVWHFPMRNRIISGLCRAVVVVQAPGSSGALITARHALEQNREVLAVPGNITETRQAGCHELIRDGARLVRNVDDILEAIPGELAPLPGPTAKAQPVAAPVLDESEARVAAALGLAPLSIDDLIEQIGMATPEVQSALVTLELKLVARRLPGNRFVRDT